MNNWYAHEKIGQFEMAERQRAAEQSRMVAQARTGAATAQARHRTTRLLTLVLFTLGRR
jgi:hypothetical protein